MNMKKKTMALLMSALLVAGGAIGGTLAWLTAQTNTVTNTFTVGDINITLQEHALEGSSTTTSNTYNFVPGDTLEKDPFVTVQGTDADPSEACYLFIKVEEKYNTLDGLTGKIINWEIAGGWTAVPGHDGYWYRTVDKTTSDTDFAVLSNDQVTVNEDITKDMVAALTSNQPQLICTAAAVQKDNVADVDAAWAKLPAAFTA